MEALQEFTASMQAEELDDAVASYILEVVQNEEPEEGVQCVSDLLSGVSPAFAALPEDDKLVKLVDLWGKVRLSQGESKAQAVPSVSAEEGSTDTTGDAKDIECSESFQAPSTVPAPVHPVLSHVSNSDLAQLQELCPDAGADYLEHILATCHTLQAAVEWLLDAGDGLSAREAAWREAQRQEEVLQREASLEEKRVKQKVLARFDLQPVQASTTGKPPKQSKPVALWTSTEPSNSKVRYLDGQPVSTKGEKYIVQKTGEDWDGGSRGKVYTKGKRGKGFQ